MDFRNPMNIWWLMMVALNIMSVAVYMDLARRSAAKDCLEPENFRYKRLMRICGGIFVGVSLYRSIFVCSYPSRLTWFPTMLNSPLVIRILATFAELSYGALVAVPILHLNREIPLEGKFTGSPLGRLLIRYLPCMTLFCLFAAQFFAYSGLCTQHLTLFAIEETLWALGFAAILPGALAHLINVLGKHRYESEYGLIRISLTLLCLFTLGYLIYQIAYSLPVTYYSRIAEDLQKPHLCFLDGANLALREFTPSRDFDTWGGAGFFIWHTGYFSICTWINIIYAMAPRKLKK